MFHNLIESGSHRRELKRRGRFLLGTLATYALLLTLAGVASVTAYTANLGAQNFEVTMLPPWTPPQPAAHPQPAETHPAAHGGAKNELPERTEAYTDLHTVTSSPPPISTQQTHVIPVPHGVFVLTDRNRDPIGGGVTGLGDNPVGLRRIAGRFVGIF